MLIRLIAFFFLFVLAPLCAQAFWHGSTFVEPVGSVSIPVSSQVNGAISANNWTGFTSPAGTVFTASTWGAANTKYLESNDFHTMVATTTAIARDVEVTTYVRDGTVFLRQSNGTAIYCRHNADGGTTGFFEFGAVDGLVGNPVNSGGSLVGTYHALYQTLDMAAAAPGYDKNNTAGATLTCGVSGITIYAKFNGTTFASVLSNYDVTPGPVGLWANNTYGFRDVTVNYLPLAPLFSSPGLARWDPRDWGLKQGQATGSITSGTSTLTLAASLGVAPGDSVIVAVGGESGAGALGTVGVGGNSPALSFANAAARDLDTTEPDGTYGWTRNDGKAFVSFSGVWSTSGLYYVQFTSPRALIANVTQVNSGGLSLVLDTNATATSTNAQVYVNNYGPINSVLQPAAILPALPNQTVAMPCGNYAIGAPMGVSYTPAMLVSLKTGWKIRGQGGEGTACPTILMSPAGATSIGLLASQVDQADISGIGVVGNNGASGFGLAWAGNIYQFNGPKGIEFSSSTNSVAHDFTTRNTFYSGFAVSFGADVTAHDFTVTQQFGPLTLEIEPYYVEFSDHTRGGASDYTVTLPTVAGGTECFRSNGTYFKRFALNNAYLSLNSCGGAFLVEDMTINVGANKSGWYTTSGALIEINNNIGGNAQINMGGTINRPTVIQQGYVDGSNGIYVGANVGVQNPNISFLGTYTPTVNGKGCFEAPDWFSGTNAFFGIAIRSDGTGTVTSGLRKIGHADYAAGHSDIYAEGGSLTATGNIMDSDVLGAGSISQSPIPAESNATWNAANPGHAGC